MVCACPTMPKRGAFTSTTRRSRSFLWPVISACTGAAKPSAAASAGAAGTRPAGGEVGPRPPAGGAAGGGRGGPGRQGAGAAGRRGGRGGSKKPPRGAGRGPEPLGGLRAHRLGLRGAIADLRAGAFVDHHRRYRGERITILARERRIGE